MKSVIEQFGAALPFSFNLAAKAAVVSNDERVLWASEPGSAPSLARSVAAAREFFGTRWQAGDVSVSNDPDRGATHVCQLTAVAPLTSEAWGVMRANLPDIGGWCPGGYSPQAIDRWAEGARFEPAKLFLAGKARREVADLLSLNSRTPKATRRVALALAEAVLKLEPTDSYDADRAKARAAIAGKQGTGTAAITTPAGIASPGEVAVRIASTGGKLSVQVTAPAVSAAPINLGEAASRDIVMSAVAAALGLDTLQSGALVELVDVKLGGLLAARVPACVGIGRETSGAALYAACTTALNGQKVAWRPHDAAGEVDWATGQLSAKSVAALLAAERQVNA
jgi:N-methylhydantoinase B/oxoprolinase/acetone carboxylase alpha subunit